MHGFDTETIEGRAILLASEKSHAWIGRVDPWDACCAFIGQGDYIAFNADYDAKAMLAYLAKPVLWRLARFGVAKVGGYSIKYIPRKLLEVKHKAHHINFRIFDVYQYYHTSLAKAAEKYLGGAKKDPVDASNIPAYLTTDEKRGELALYCRQDALLALLLWERLEDPLQALGVDTSRPISGASLAAKYILGKKPTWATKRENNLAHPAYYGGRVEMYRRGWFPHATEIDMHSAYPAAMLDLPDLRDCRMVPMQGNYPAVDAEVGIYYVRVRADIGAHIGPVPVRGKVLTYPVGAFDTWVDRATLDSLESYGMLAGIMEGWEWIPKKSVVRRPFKKFAELYLLRADPALKLAVKLLMNGLSGKLAQQDRKWVETPPKDGGMLDPDLEMYLSHIIRDGPHTRFALAATLTGRTRAKLFEAMQTAPHKVIAVATDAVWFEGARKDLSKNLDIGPGMGQWGVEFEDVSLLQIACGMYGVYEQNGQHLHSACRGMHARIDWRSALEKAPHQEFITYDVGLPSTLLWALREKRPVNEIGTMEKQVDLNCDIKRYWDWQMNAQELLHNTQCSQPLIER